MSRLSLTLTIAGLLGALLILILSLGPQLQVPFLFPGRDDAGSPSGPDDAGFPAGLHGKVPQYEVRTSTGTRDCQALLYTEACYWVHTKAVDKQSLALIVEDIIRDYNRQESQDKVVEVTFFTPKGNITANAFRNKAAAKEAAKNHWAGSKRFFKDTTVVGGVYFYGWTDY